MTHLTDEQCVQIVRASIDPDRVLAGLHGHDGSPPDVLLTTVERIVTEREQQIARNAEASELVPDRWWITTDFFERGGERVMGPFASQELAIEVRALREQVEGHCRYFVDSEGGDQS